MKLKSGISALTFILATGFLAFNFQVGVVSDISFFLHTIPFILVYGGGSIIYLILYYAAFWLILFLIFTKILKLIVDTKSQNTKK